MIKRALGFPGERFIYLPLELLDRIKDSPLTGDLYVYSLGFFSRALHHYINRPTGCEQYILIYCTEGEGWIILNGKKYTLTANQFIILPPCIQHSYGASDISPWSIYWIHFLGDKAPLYSKKFYVPTSITPSDTSRIEERIKLFDEIYMILKNGFSQENLNYANVCFAHFLATFLYLEQYRNGRSPSEYAESIINRATYYMNENLNKKLTVDDLAAYVGYSPSYFYRKFVKETGYAPMDYFMRMKINSACLYLIKTDLRINQIAYMLGFTDAYYFTRVFTKIIGISPSDFRKENFQFK